MEKILNELFKNNAPISNYANMSAYIYNNFSDLNWAGFYFVHNNELILGPFQGNIACTKIPYGKGVCGTCFKEQKTIVVDNVLEFKGHIACDSNSRSEICIPVFKNNVMVALLDIDAPIYNRFDNDFKIKLEKAVKILENHI